MNVCKINETNYIAYQLRHQPWKDTTTQQWKRPMLNPNELDSQSHIPTHERQINPGLNCPKLAKRMLTLVLVLKSCFAGRASSILIGTMWFGCLPHSYNCSAGALAALGPGLSWPLFQLRLARKHIPKGEMARGLRNSWSGVRAWGDYVSFGLSRKLEK